MNITCPSCAKQFRVPEGAIGAEGRTVRCSGCAHTWHQMPGAEAAEAAPEATPEATPESAPEAAPEAGVAEDTPETDAGSGEEAGAAPDADQGETADEAEGEAKADADADAEVDADTDTDTAGEQEESSRDRLTAIRRRTGEGDAEEDGEAGGKRRRPGIVFGWVALVAVVGGALAGAALLRQQVLDSLPAEARLQAAAIYDAVGLDFDLPGYGLEIELDEPSRGAENGHPVLVISGRVVNESGRPRAMPPLQGVLLDETGQALQSFDVDPGIEVLADGEVAEFRQVITSPDESARELHVDFGGEEPEMADEPMTDPAAADPAEDPVEDPAADPAEGAATEDD